jgi:hypothetical protein
MTAFVASRSASRLCSLTRLARSARPLAVAAVLAWLPLAGCSTAAPPEVTAPAKQTVVTFLEAIKRGDDAAARNMLTATARAKTQELGISVAPPVNDSAAYTVRDCEVIGEGGDLVHVATTWTDVDPDGFQSSDNVIWVVRLDPEGWRVVGMAMRVFEDLPPLLLNFEDPEDMLAKQAMVAEELQRRARAAALQQQSGPRTAGNPGDGRQQ